MNAEADQQLITAAIAVRERSYSPYSNFKVGAAVRDESGLVHVGANVENAAFPSGICAEGGAISAMIASGGQRIFAIAIVGQAGVLCTPCGSCRQRIREFGTNNTIILVGDPTGQKEKFTLGELLPESFGPDVFSGG